MNKAILLIILFFSVQSDAQKAVVALPAMNIVYIGLENPVQIAVEGYTRKQLTVSCENCTIVPTSQYYSLKVTRAGTCKVIVSYKKRRSLKADTLLFRIKSVPHPESMFGELESGSGHFHQLMNQNTINCVLPGFHYNGVGFKVIKYDLLYVPRIGQTQSFSSNSDAISLEVKKLILHSKNGDKILVDDIQAHGTGGITRRLNPIAITIQKAQTCQTIQPDYYTYQETENSKIETTRYLDNNSQLFKNNESLVFKGYKVQCNDTQFLVEVKKNSKKTFWEKHYYPSGKLKAEYNFESNDTIGTATSFYESGKIKSVGNLIAKNISIIEDCVGFVFEGASFADTHLIDSFLFHNYAPIGQWKGYYENGKVTLECTLNLYKYGQIPLKEGDPIFDIWNNRTKILASIKEAIKSKDEYFKPKLTGSFKLYDRQGQIINEQNFKD